jgi:GGDEF domain-containing protein
MTISVGATLARADDESGAVVLARADGAMYEAKQSGGDAFVLRQ